VLDGPQSCNTGLAAWTDYWAHWCQSRSWVFDRFYSQSQVYAACEVSARKYQWGIRKIRGKGTNDISFILFAVNWFFIFSLL